MAPRDSLGDYERTVLLVVLRLGDEAYGMTIKREIESLTGKSQSVGALYTTLSRLEKKGFVTSATGEPTPERGGRAKKYFALSPSGRQRLADSMNVLRQIATGVQILEAQ